MAFKSRALKPAEHNLPITMLELLAVVWAVEEFHGYLHSAEFSIVTDYRSLEWLRKQSNFAGRLAQWAAMLVGYNFQISYRKGESMGLPDALSRLVGVVDVGDSGPASLRVAEYINRQDEDEVCRSVRGADGRSKIRAQYGWRAMPAGT